MFAMGQYICFKGKIYCKYVYVSVTFKTAALLAGHAVSMINADQYRSMTNQISGIDPKYSSININVDQ